jgi:23S rRNA (adenine-N6)-dimethyltransferase
MSRNGNLGTNPPTWVSQNFLTSTKTIQRLIKSTSINNNDYVIEIGPGKGHITNILLKQCKRMTAIEIDKKLYTNLKEKFINTENLCLKHQDFLKWNLPAHDAYKVFSNIPFSITTDILRKLTESKNPPEEAWLVTEKGAAKRFIGKPHETLRSLLLKPMFDVNIAYYFCREDFHPIPSVDVVLLHLKKKAQPDIPANQQHLYEKFISECMQNGIYGLRHIFTKKQLSKAIQTADIPIDFTPGEILYIQWLCLFRCYREHCLS